MIWTTYHSKSQCVYQEKARSSRLQCQHIAACHCYSHYSQHCHHCHQCHCCHNRHHRHHCFIVLHSENQMRAMCKRSFWQISKCASILLHHCSIALSLSLVSLPCKSIIRATWIVEEKCVVDIQVCQHIVTSLGLFSLPEQQWGIIWTDRQTF